MLALFDFTQKLKAAIQSKCWFGSWQCCLHHMHFSQPCADGLHSPSRTRAARLPCALMNNALMNLIVQPVLYNLQIQAYYVTHCTYCNKRWPGIVTVRVQQKLFCWTQKKKCWVLLVTTQLTVAIGFHRWKNYNASQWLTAVVWHQHMFLTLCIQLCIDFN